MNKFPGAAALVLALVFLFACEDVVYMGSVRDGFTVAQENTISPERARELAQPFLAECYARRKAQRLSNLPGPPTDIVVQKGDWYFVTRDNYPYKTLGAYTHTAVRVHTETGEIVNGCRED
ncbi:MAG: hypothetical protein EPN93_06155 [Spirochaetes bacterium]|nr:MAG: hypothetical protein EPN93_06155 [Spirochaetota bacterium]